MEYSDEILQLIEAYLRGTIDTSSLSELNKILASDTELAEKVADFKTVIDVLDDESWAITDFDGKNTKAKDYFNFYTKKENQDYLHQLETIEYQETIKKNNLKSIFGALAIAALLVIGFFIVKPMLNTTNEDLFATNYDEIPGLTVRGPSSEKDSINHLIEANFKSKNYKGVTDIIDFNESKFDSKELELLYIYKGVSYSEQKLYGKASNALSNEAIFQDSLYKQMADWYLALSFMKSNNKIDGKKLLEKLSEDQNHYKQLEAKQILRKLD